MSYFDDFIMIQKLLINISEISFQTTEDEMKRYILQNIFFEKRIIYNILNLIKYRSSKTIFYFRLIENLFQTNEVIKKYLLSLITTDTPSSNYEQRVPQIYLLFLLVKNEFYSMKTLIEFLISIEEKTAHFYLIFAWFCPEIQNENHQFFDVIIENKIILNDWPQQLKLFYTQFDKYKENDWKLLKEKRLKCYEKDSIMNKIINNEPNENLLDYFDKRIRVSIFEINWILWNYPNYVEFCAFYGSLLNLKFCIENGFDFSEDFQTLDLLSFAIAGGNEDVIKYIINDLKFSIKDFPNSEFISILFYQNDFIEKIEIKEKYSSMFGSLGQIACLSNNLYILKKMKLSFNNQIDYFLSSIENGESDATFYLIENSNNIKVSNEFLLKLIEYEYISLILKLLPAYSSFLLKNMILLKKRNLFKNVIKNDECLTDDKIEDDLVILSILLNEEEIFYLLIRKFPSKLKIKTSEKETLLSLAVQQKNIKLVKFLLDFNVIDVNEADIFLFFFVFIQ